MLHFVGGGINMKKLRNILHKLDWIKILDTATKRRKTSWNFQGYGHPVVEWRNASDEVCMAVINALEDKGILEDKSKALCGICLFNNAFETAWNESDNESKGHIDYWAKMKLRVRDKLKFVLCDGGENE